MPQDDQRSPHACVHQSDDQKGSEPPQRDAYRAALAALQAEATAEVTAANDGLPSNRRSLARCIFCAVSKLFRPGRRTTLVDSWLPALDGVVAKLEAGARVADIGCSHGHGTLIMAEAFPRSQFIGLDEQPVAIDIAHRHAARHNLANLRVETAAADSLGRHRFDGVTCFDWLHSVRDPGSVASRVRNALSDDGTWMIVEPGYLADDPGSVAPLDSGVVSLASRTDETDLRALIARAGFTRIRQAAETPFNMILEARP